MKTMVMFDLLTAWGFMKQQVVVSIVVALVFAGATDMPLGLIPLPGPDVRLFRGLHAGGHTTSATTGRSCA